MTDSNGLDTWDRRGLDSDGANIPAGNRIGGENTGILKKYHTESSESQGFCVYVCICLGT